MKFSYDYAACSETGMKESNQDRYLIESDEETGAVFCMVADGIGGVAGGEAAADICRLLFSSWFRSDFRYISRSEYFGMALADAWSDKIAMADQICKQGADFGGTTLTLLLLHGGSYYAANVGDSRAYLMRDGELFQITKDHSWVQQQLDDGVEPEKIQQSKLKNTITRCIGLDTGDICCNRPDFYTNDYGPGDMFLICTDGFRHKIRVSQMVDFLKDCTGCSDKLNNITEYVLAAGETDNITSCLIEVKS